MHPAARPRMTTLDILVPHYRDGPGLARSLASIAAQTWPGELRAVVLDDGSPEAELDAAAEIVRGSGLRATMMRNPRNLGRPVTRNRLLGLVEAPYVAWLDAGDEWYPAKLEAQFAHLRRLEAEGADLGRVWVTCDYEWVQDGAPPRQLRQRVEGDQLRELLVGDAIRSYLWTLLGRRDAFRLAGLFDEALPRLQDLDYFLRFVRGGGRLEVPPEAGPLCAYHKTDLGRDHAAVSRAAWHVYDKHRAAYESYGPALVARARWKNAWLGSRYAMRNRAYGAAALYFARAFATGPRYTAYRARKAMLGR